MSLPDAASQRPAISVPAARIRAPSGVNAPYMKFPIPGSANEAMSLPEAASHSLTLSSIWLAVRIRAPSGLKAARITCSRCRPLEITKEVRSLPEVASQSLAVPSALAVRIRAPSGLNAASRSSAGWAKEARSLPETASQSLAL